MVDYALRGWFGGWLPAPNLATEQVMNRKSGEILKAETISGEQQGFG
jgi:hypothetical protein